VVRDPDAEFLRARRHQVLATLAGWVRHDSHAVEEELSFGEVVDALGHLGERDLGVQEIPLDRIVGSVDRMRDFDRRFRPTSNRGRERWADLARRTATGEQMEPISVYELGDLYFVRDGHHRVSVARALGRRTIAAHVTHVDTEIDTEGIGGRRDLEAKNWGRRFLRRVPLTGERRDAIRCTDPSDYHRLAEMVEAWAARQMHAEGGLMDKETMARRWYDEEYSPVLELIDQAGVRGKEETGADAYIRVAGERYRLIREHDWNADVVRLVKKEGRAPRR
jgi:hypothetical protein